MNRNLSETYGGWDADIAETRTSLYDNPQFLLRVGRASCPATLTIERPDCGACDRGRETKCEGARSGLCDIGHPPTRPFRAMPNSSAAETRIPRNTLLLRVAFNFGGDLRPQCYPSILLLTANQGIPQWSRRLSVHDSCCRRGDLCRVTGSTLAMAAPTKRSRLMDRNAYKCSRFQAFLSRRGGDLHDCAVGSTRIYLSDSITFDRGHSRRGRMESSPGKTANHCSVPSGGPFLFRSAEARTGSGLVQAPTDWR